MSWEKVAKPTISPSAGVLKEESQDQKNFHYIYILKKQSEEAKPPVEVEAEGEIEGKVENEPKQDS